MRCLLAFLALTSLATVADAQCVGGQCTPYYYEVYRNLPYRHVPAIEQPAVATSSISLAATAGQFDRLLVLHNGERSRRRLAPLRTDAVLTQGAQLSAQAQADRQRIGHFVPLPLYGAWAENVAQGQTSQDIVNRSWVQSRGHYNNITGPYSRVGFGLVNAPRGPYWSARFGR